MRETNLAFRAQRIVFFIRFSTRDSRRFRLQLRRGSICFCILFPILFWETVGRLYLKTTIHGRLSKTKNVTPFESLGCTLRELHTKFQNFSPKFANLRKDKTGKCNVILSAGPACRV